MQPSSWWCPACRTNCSAVPALAPLESCLCCHLWCFSSCSGSSPAFWLAVVWQTVVTCKPYCCSRISATGGKVNCSPWFLAHIPMALGNSIPSHGTVLPVPPGLQMNCEMFLLEKCWSTHVVLNAGWRKPGVEHWGEMCL